MNKAAMKLKIKSILDSIRLNVSTQKLYGLWITDLVIGGSLLNILNGAPITKIKSRNGMDRIKIKLFLIEKFITLYIDSIKIFQSNLKEFML